MGSNINVRVRGELRNHLDQQVGENGMYENASEYVRDLIRRDMKDRLEGWDWLKQHLEPALRADAGEFVAVSADDVITRNLNS